MTQYIPKDALVAEIERKLKNIHLNYVSAGLHPSDFDINKKLQDGISKNLQDLLSLINTLEVKEVDLEKELYDIKRACGIFKENDIGEISSNCLDWVAKHFFELGLKAAQKEE